MTGISDSLGVLVFTLLAFLVLVFILKGFREW